MIIDPHIAVGELQFGLKRPEIRELFSVHEENRTLGPLSKTWMPSDDYSNVGVSVKYTKYDRCGAIELSENSQAKFKETNLFELTWDELVELLQVEDSTLQYGEDTILSKNLGFSISCDPSVGKAERILVFHPDFFTIFSGAPNPVRKTSFSIQVGFIEDNEINNTQQNTIEDAAKEVFQATKERGILLWNSIPIAFDYQLDFPALMRNITPILTEMHWSNKGDALFSVKSNNLDFAWRLKWNEDILTIDSEWRKVSMNYEGVLRTMTLKKVEMSKTKFMEEWKMPLVQFDRAVEAHGIEFRELDSQDIQLQIVDLLTYIKSAGKFYGNVPESEFNYRSDRLKFWKSFGLSVLIVGGGFISLYFVAREEGQDVYWWIKKYWFSLLLTSFFIFGFLLLLPFLLRKK